MQKVVRRFISFFLDLMVVTLLVTGISNLPTFSNNTLNIERIRKEAQKDNKLYKELSEEIDDILEDALVDEKEYNRIHTIYYEYRKAFDDIKPETNVPKKVIDNIHDDIDELYLEKYNNQIYEIARLSRYQSIIAIIIYILYFGLLQYLLKGQTIFKRIFKIRVVDNKNINKRVPLWKFLIRSILICDIIFTTADLIAISNLNIDTYLIFYNSLGNVRFFYEVIFILFIMLRDDQRSIHDLLLNTKIIRYDKSGHIQNDILFKVEENTKEKKEQIKSPKKVREEVKAEKVND